MLSYNTLKKEVQFFCTYFNLSIKIKDEEDGFSIDDTYYINIEKRTVKSFIPFEVDKYVVNRKVIIPGKSYMSNGDPGYPDEIDYEEIIVDRNYFKVTKAIITILLNEEIDNILEGKQIDLELETE